jgi:hypothetical protein
MYILVLKAEKSRKAYGYIPRPRHQNVGLNGNRPTDIRKKFFENVNSLNVLA